MDVAPLFHKKNSDETTIFYLGEPWCEVCRVKLDKIGFFVSNWNKRNTFHKIMCSRCSTEAETSEVYRSQERRPVRVVDRLPRGVVPFVIQHHGFSSRRDMSVFDAATRNIDGEEVIDRTRLSGRPEATLFPDMQVGKDVRMIEEERQFGKDANPEDVFAFHLNAAPALPGKEDDQKLLGENED